MVKRCESVTSQLELREMWFHFGGEKEGTGDHQSEIVRDFGQDRRQCLFGTRGHDESATACRAGALLFVFRQRLKFRQEHGTRVRLELSEHDAIECGEEPLQHPGDVLIA